MYETPDDEIAVLMVDDVRTRHVELIARTAAEAKQALLDKKWSHLLIDHDLMDFETGHDVLVWAGKRRLLPKHIELLGGFKHAVTQMATVLIRFGYTEQDSNNFHYDK